ncbi:potassium transporter peripheral membrane protein [Clostridia bacterium]|nr:potassium transporter peripheral membrane protein [Clostridia bacterium]
MQIVIAGCGTVGGTLTEQLSREGHDITVIDSNAKNLERVVNLYDVMGVVGNAASSQVQKEAGIEDAALMIAVTTSDELNLLCCLIAKKVGHCRTVARVRNYTYNDDVEFIKAEMGLSMIINPAQSTALELSRLLKYPSAIKVDTFAKGKVELLQSKIMRGSPLCDGLIREILLKLHVDVLICAVERGGEVYIPDGNFILKEGDVIFIVGAPEKANDFFRKIGMNMNQIRCAMIVGGGETPYYLAKQLLSMKIDVTIIERDKKRCNELSELLPKALIICGDGTGKDLLQSEGLDYTQAFVSWLNIDEENVMLSLFVRRQTQAKLITKIHRVAYKDIISSMDIGSVFYPQNVTADYISQYIRAMQNTAGSNIETLYHLIDDKVEAMEFHIHKQSTVVGVPLMELRLKKNVLICVIKRGKRVITPGGQDMIKIGDRVVVVTTNEGFSDITDILE